MTYTETLSKYFPIRKLRLVPEIRAMSLTKSIEYPVTVTNDNTPYALPYWHSQALARYILDNPNLFAGKTVVDVGCGCGVAAIAASVVGAESIALDPDLRCLEFTERNAAENHVSVEVVWGDHRSTPQTDILIAGGVFHEPHGQFIATRAKDMPSLIAVSVCNLWDMRGFIEVAHHDAGQSRVKVFKSLHL